MFEIWTWAQLGFHDNPCGALNVEGYYDALIRFLDHTADAQFVRAEHRRILCVEPDLGVLLDRYEEYTPPLPKWLKRDQT